MHFELIANPVSGTMGIDKKKQVLKEISNILGSGIQGLDTGSAEEFSRCAKEVAQTCDVLVIAGGDGTFSDVINAVDTSEKPVAFIPLGTGNALRHSLGYEGSVVDIASKILNGRIHDYDLIDCDNRKKAFMASIGIDGTVIKIHDDYVAKGKKGFKTYPASVMEAFFSRHKPCDVEISIDGKKFLMKKTLTLMIVKQPYYGFGLKVVPKAKFDDCLLHIMFIKHSIANILSSLAASATTGNMTGDYRTGCRIDAVFDNVMPLQIDGNYAWEAKEFRFTVLPKALKVVF